MQFALRCGKLRGTNHGCRGHMSALASEQQFRRSVHVDRDDRREEDSTVALCKHRSVHSTGRPAGGTRGYGIRRVLGLLVVAVLSTALICAPTTSIAQDLTGNLGIHDPSTVMFENGNYYVFATGYGISRKRSSDRIDWHDSSTVFNYRSIPGWTFSEVPAFDGTFWAPDIAYFNGLYHLYYSVSSWGSQDSAIGMATSPTLDSTDPGYSWADQGPVIQSSPGDPYNTIDPAIIKTSSGQVWMSFGSYWNGIYLARLDPLTGQRYTRDLRTYSVARRSVGGSTAIEASYLYERDGYFYLFAHWDRCCDGVNSTYNIRVGRSTSITGPYLDRNGFDMVNGGGTLFLGSEGDFIGPGHISIFSDEGIDWFGYHYYDGDNNGAPTYNLRTLLWDEQGWPVAGPSLPPNLPGDYNGDHVVDAADYTVWRDGLASGTYTLDDYDVWKQHFGETWPAGALASIAAGTADADGPSPVPEPGALPFALTAWLVVLRHKSRRDEGVRP